MSNYDKFRFLFGHLPAEQKLITLYPESLPILTRLQGFAALLLKAIEQREMDELPQDFEAWCKQIAASSDELSDLVQALVGPHYKDGRLGRPELRFYETLLDAVRGAAQELALPLADAIDEKSRILVHSQYPLVLLDEPKYQHEAMLSLDNLGYSVELLSWTDQSMFQVVYEVQPSSLAEAVIIMSRWLTEHWTIDKIQRM